MGQVKLVAVGKNYVQYRALQQIDLAIAAGELLVLVGPSGCGKSTLLRSIAGLETIDEGEIYIGGQLVASAERFVTARERDVAMVFQNYALYPHMSVADNLAFGLRMRGTPARERQIKVQQMAELLGLEALLSRKPAQLSGGQQQRVAVGRALVRDPQVFLLDEPLSNLDTELRNQTRSELKRLHQRLGTTMIYVTHDQVEAMTLADRIVVMAKGRLQQVGTPDDIYCDPANVMVAQFLGHPPMNLLPIRRLEADWYWQDTCLEPDGPLRTALERFPGQDAWLGVRPEAIVAGEPPGGPEGVFKVELIEPLGNETVVQGTLGDTSASLRTPGNVRWQVGDSLPVSLDLTSAVAFDPQTGARLR
ncbi:ABC transporter ATP-binding protein [Gloeobacter kilaueensis]|uniref:ABC transporter n=1 Tax=Gloeobacter kilaueensis (strain ATCC BAA-2537 / CCAP 1431/1 / ULC 316 / JS1) TaxID=1183438 RepID=U5QCM3_GLOK1|nr:sn-glycerol-3-phosphate ABC transporter ATP-binding protein UgpC [Gloeobacter kilaueensis]AGY56626.1 ABC transporter [Gloeobacter kilaueensis JS1]